MRIVPREGVSEITKPTDIQVSQHDIDRFTRLLGVRRVMDREYGEGGWGDREIKAYIQKRKFDEFEKRGRQREEISPVEKRLQGYLEAFDVLTPNDEEMLRAMADIEVRLGTIRELLDDETSPTEIKKLTEVQTKLLTEHRQLQTILGIDKAGRERGKKAKSALDEIQELVAEGARFIEEQLVKISHCGIQMGWLLYHFDEMGYKFETRCPRCREEVQICISPDPSYSTDAA